MSKGATLIEIVISLGILSLGILAVVGAFPFGMRMVDFNRSGNTALFLATHEIESAIEDGYHNLENGIEVIDFGEFENFESYRIERRVDYFDTGEEGGDDTGLKLIEVEVFTDGANRSVVLNTLISER